MVLFLIVCSEEGCNKTVTGKGAQAINLKNCVLRKLSENVCFYRFVRGHLIANVLMLHWDKILCVCNKGIEVFTFFWTHNEM